MSFVKQVKMNGVGQHCLIGAGVVEVEEVNAEAAEDLSATAPELHPWAAVAVERTSPRQTPFRLGLISSS